MKLCRVCSKEFELPNSRSRTLFCSETCRVESRRKVNRQWAARKRASDPAYVERTRAENRAWYRRTGMTPKHHFQSTRSGAKRRNLEFSITFEDFAGLTSKACYYCNRNEFVGVDRIDNSVGYVLSNCQPCCKHCNQAKRQMTDAEFLQLIRDIYETRIKNVPR